MKILQISLLTTFFLISINLSAYESIGNDDLQESSPIVSNAYIYDFAYGGNGCPQGSLEAQLSPDQNQISLNFSQYNAQTSTAIKRVRKSCNFGVSVHVPHGLRVSLISLKYQGSVAIDPGAYTSLQAEYFESGEPAGTTFKKEWYNEKNIISENFIAEHKFPVATVAWSACGKDTILRSNTSIKAFQNVAGGDAYINIDRLDGSEEVIFQLQWETCT